MFKKKIKAMFVNNESGIASFAFIIILVGIGSIIALKQSQKITNNIRVNKLAETSESLSKTNLSVLTLLQKLTTHMEGSELPAVFPEPYASNQSKLDDLGLVASAGWQQVGTNKFEIRLPKENADSNSFDGKFSSPNSTNFPVEVSTIEVMSLNKLSDSYYSSMNVKVKTGAKGLITTARIPLSLPPPPECEVRVDGSPSAQQYTNKTFRIIVTKGVAFNPVLVQKSITYTLPTKGRFGYTDANSVTSEDVDVGSKSIRLEPNTTRIEGFVLGADRTQYNCRAQAMNVYPPPPPPPPPPSPSPAPAPKPKCTASKPCKAPACPPPSGKACRTGARKAGKSGCFADHTEILMADGTSRKITDVMIGDLVWNPILKAPSRVKRMIKGPEKKPLVSVRLDGHEVHVTSKHPFQTHFGLMAAQDLKPGDEILSSSGDYKVITQTKFLPVKKHEIVWNIELENRNGHPNGNYLVGDGVLTGDLYLQEKLAEKLKDKS